MTIDVKELATAPAAPGELGRLRARLQAAQAHHSAQQAELARARTMISDAKRTIAGATLDSDFADVARARAQQDVAERWEEILKVRVGHASDALEAARTALGRAEARVRQLQGYLRRMATARSLELDQEALDFDPAGRGRRYIVVERGDVERELAALTQG